MRPGTECEQHDAHDAAGDVDGVGLHAIGPKIERPAKPLPRTNECQRDDDEEKAAEYFDWDRVAKEIRHPIRAAKEDDFGRRPIDPVLHKRAAGNLNYVR